MREHEGSPKPEVCDKVDKIYISGQSLHSFDFACTPATLFLSVTFNALKCRAERKVLKNFPTAFALQQYWQRMPPHVGIESGVL